MSRSSGDVAKFAVKDYDEWAGSDGGLYVLTSNRDGRGSPSDEDDRVLRIVPPPA
ncbi:MAG: hypothetical protein ACRDL0_10410 [Thermoleophilaceae bacterium]